MTIQNLLSISVKFSSQMTSKALTDEKIRQLLNGIDSDCSDFTDDDSVVDPDFVCDVSDTEGITLDEEDLCENEYAGVKEIVVSDGTFDTPIVHKKPYAHVARRLVLWKQKNLHLSDEEKQFRGTEELPLSIKNLETSYEFFNLFMTDSFLQHIVNESISYSVEKDPNKPLELTTNELRKYFGICLVMSYVHVSNTKDYWSSTFENDLIKTTMSYQRFENIRRYLHFSPNSEQLPVNHENHDRLHKIRPVVEHFRRVFSNIPMEECLSVDEQMCPTKGKAMIKQYMPAKPHKWGIKLFVLCGASGYAYDFEVYTGKENEPSSRKDGEPDLGASSNIVVRLSRNIKRNVAHKLYFDNYYTYLDLVVWLSTQGIYSLGTIRRNRMPNCKMPTDKDIKSKTRGTSVEMVTTHEGVDVSCVVWLDNKIVLRLYTLAGVNPLGTIRRYDRPMKKYIDIDCLSIVSQYNKHMGGVDLLDSLVGRHRNKMRSRRWYMRFFII